LPVHYTGKPLPSFPFAPRLPLPQSPSPCTNKLLYLTSMSHTHPTASSSTSTSSPNFQLVINNALNTYRKRTRKDLLTHPLAAQLQSCESPAAILALLEQQAQGLDPSQSTDDRWTKWLDPTINVLYTFSNILGAGVSLVCFRTYAFLRYTFSYLCRRYSPLRAPSLPELGFFFQCV
jgi:hypothetical protein